MPARLLGALIPAFVCALWCTVSPAIAGRPQRTSPAIVSEADREARQAIEIRSPHGRVRFAVSAPGGHLSGSATFDGRSVLGASLGIIVDGLTLGESVALDRVERYHVDETYPSRGVHSWAANRCNGGRIYVRQVAKTGGPTQSGLPLELDARVFDDGLAFRYVVPGAEGERRVPEAATAFQISDGSTVWYHGLEGHYEGVYGRKAIGDVGAGDWAAMPLTIRLPDRVGYAAIAEAALIGYSGMVLQAEGRGTFRARLAHAAPVAYPFTLRYAREEAERLSHPAAVEGTITTPWSVVMVGADLNTLVNSDIFTNLSPPPDARLFPGGLATPWIRPGRAVWKFLDGGESTLEGMKEFSRMAGELGFEYNVVEGFWARWSADELRDLVSYSAARGVRIWLWKHRRDLGEAGERRRFFRQCREAGIAGLKVDFFDHEAKEVIELYSAILRDAAEAGLMIAFHGANKPTGEARTWPNEMTREAIYGLEHRNFTARAAFDTTAPFARLLAGHADYTPVIFGQRRGDTTWAHQIATAAVLTSPLLVYGANPSSLLSNPGVDVIKSVPSVWDETIVLPASEIGGLAAFARRNGGEWFLALVNGPTARTLRIPLSFLGKGRYRALMVRDAPDTPDAVTVEPGAVTRGGSLEVVLRPGGGFLGRFSPPGHGEGGRAAGQEGRAAGQGERTATQGEQRAAGR